LAFLLQHVIVSDPTIADLVMQASPADGLDRDDNYGVFDLVRAYHLLEITIIKIVSRKVEVRQLYTY
jgi:hypothetical protein